MRRTSNKLILIPAKLTFHSLCQEVKTGAVDSKTGTVWALTEAKLVRYGPTGSLLGTLDLQPLGVKEAKQLTLDPYDSSVWVAGGSSLLHVRGDGMLLGAYTCPGKINSLALALDESLWALGDTQLWRYSRNGALLSSYNLSGLLTDTAKFVAVDSLNHGIWVASEHQLIELSATNLTNRLVNITYSPEIERVALDQRSGAIWVLAGSSLNGYAPDGTLIKSISLSPLGITEAERIAYDPVSAVIWVGGNSGLYKFSLNGALLGSIASGKEVEAIAVSRSMRFQSSI